MKFKKGDEVIITGGKDRGKRGKIEMIFPKKMTILVPGLNLFKRHLKKKDEKNQGGILSLPRPVAIANLAVVCPVCNKPTRVGFSLEGKDKRRICKRCKKQI